MLVYDVQILGVAEGRARSQSRPGRGSAGAGSWGLRSGAGEVVAGSPQVHRQVLAGQVDAAGGGAVPDGVDHGGRLAGGPQMSGDRRGVRVPFLPGLGAVADSRTNSS
jgi:hypothetical protein